MKACFLFLLFMLTNICFCDDFSIVSGVLDDKRGDVLAAFGDFNADKLIDIFVISHSGCGLDVLLGQDKKQFLRKTLLTNESIPEHSTIAGVMLADFDGDVLMDVLVTTKKTSAENRNSVLQISVYWGNGTAVDIEDPYKFHDEEFRDEPVLFDFNADMIPDLLTQGADNFTVVWQAIADQKNFTKLNFTKWIDLRVPHSSAFIDLDHDYNADLILTKDKGEFEVFTNNTFDVSTTFSIDPNFVIGQSSFADFNQDGYIDHVVPVMPKGSEGESFVYFRDGKNKSQWLRVSDSFDSSESLFDKTKRIHPPYSLDLPVTLRVGDYDMDGYPDLLVILYSQTNGAKPFLLRNVLNDKGDGRKFTIQRDALPSSINSTLLATFYDYIEDGMPDILVTALGSDGVPYSVLMSNNLALDTCFLKVTVISGLCAVNCPKDRKPYGVNVPGPTVVYSTTQTNGNPQTSSGGQLSQSAHFALQLPFVSFGLGQMPNFVDEVGVGIPQSKDLIQKNVNRTKVWTQIIPNAQLIVNPIPNNEPSNWRMQLFVVPSQQIYLTGIALLCTCVVLALIVAILLWNEKKEDKREKKNESQRFHFDAM